MAAILLRKNNSKRARNGCFPELKRVSRKRAVSKLETNSSVKVKRDKKTLAMSLGRHSLVYLAM